MKASLTHCRMAAFAILVLGGCSHWSAQPDSAKDLLPTFDKAIAVSDSGGVDYEGGAVAETSDEILAPASPSDTGPLVIPQISLRTSS